MSKNISKSLIKCALIIFYISVIIPYHIIMKRESKLWHVVNRKYSESDFKYM